MSLKKSTPRFHSAYNPLREAEQFILHQNLSFEPAYIVISEPGESWLAQVLKKIYPNSILIALRYSNDWFLEFDYLWDFVWRPKKDSNTLSHFLLNIIPDELLLQTVFWSWKPADTFWPKQSKEIWEQIQTIISIQSTIIQTRHFFGQTWLYNMFTNILYAKNIYTLNEIHSNIIITAAGPTLEKNLTLISDDFFVLSVSSALTALDHYLVKPDLCIITDGGFWTKSHFTYNNYKNLTLAFPLEARIPKDFLLHNPLVFLNYGSKLENFFLNALSIKSTLTKRNGTVTGTAVDLGLTRSKGKIYIAGLDLDSSSTFSHARPHPSVEKHYFTSNRLNPIACSLFTTAQHTKALKIYSKWFSSQKDRFASRVFRIQPTTLNIFNINEISMTEAISSNPINKKNKDFIKKHKINYNLTEKKIILTKLVNDLFNTTKNVLEFQEKSNTEIIHSIEGELLSLISFTDYISFLKIATMKNQDNTQYNSLKEKLTKKLYLFQEKILKRIHDCND